MNARSTRAVLGLALLSCAVAARADDEHKPTAEKADLARAAAEGTKGLAADARKVLKEWQPPDDLGAEKKDGRLPVKVEVLVDGTGAADPKDLQEAIRKALSESGRFAPQKADSKAVCPLVAKAFVVGLPAGGKDQNGTLAVSFSLLVGVEAKGEVLLAVEHEVRVPASPEKRIPCVGSAEVSEMAEEARARLDRCSPDEWAEKDGRARVRLDVATAKLDPEVDSLVLEVRLARALLAGAKWAPVTARLASEKAGGAAAPQAPLALKGELSSRAFKATLEETAAGGKVVAKIEKTVNMFLPK